MNEWLRKILFLPPQASTIAQEIDELHYFVISMTMLGATVVTVLGGYYIIRYRRRWGTETGQPRALGRPLPLWIEGVLIVAVLGLFVLFWAIGVRQFARLRIAPPGALDVYVIGKQWMWLFAYPDGRGSISRLYVPAGRPVRLLISSRDVIHSFFVPEFRIKHDAVPGRMTSAWFEAKEPGTYPILCTEYCGAGHSTMRGEVVALSPEDYSRWLDEGTEELRAAIAPQDYLPPSVVEDYVPRAAPVSLREQGLTVSSRYGCLRCHTLDGAPHIGPSWLGLYLSTVPMEDGKTLIADDGYLTQSIMDPLARVRRGFAPVMPSYLGRIEPAEVAAVVELIRSLRDPFPEEIYEVPIADGGLGAAVVVPEGPASDDRSPAILPSPDPLPTEEQP